MSHQSNGNIIRAVLSVAGMLALGAYVGGKGFSWTMHLAKACAQYFKAPPCQLMFGTRVLDILKLPEVFDDYAQFFVKEYPRKNWEPPMTRLTGDGNDILYIHERAMWGRRETVYINRPGSATGIFTFKNGEVDATEPPPGMKALSTQELRALKQFMELLRERLPKEPVSI